MRHLMACLSIAWGPIPTAREPDLAVAILPPSKYLLGSKAAERRRGQKYAPTSAPPLRPDPRAARNDCSSGLTPSRFWTSPTRWSDGSRLTLRVATGTNKWWKRSKAIASAGEQKRTTKCCLAQEIFELVFISRSKNTDLT
jgi:hypothetical protein